MADGLLGGIYQGYAGQAISALQPDSIGGLVAGGLGLTAAAGATAALSSPIGMGLLSAFGADYHVANNRMGVSYSGINPASARNILQFGTSNVQSVGLAQGVANPITNARVTTPSAAVKSAIPGVHKGGKLSPLIGTGLTVLFGIQAMDDGPGAVPKYIAQEVFANYSGLMHSHHFFKDGAGNTIGQQRSVAGFKAGGRVTSTIGAYIGSGIGYDIGASVGGAIGGMLHENLETPGKYIGAMGGALVGAEAGGYLMRGARAGKGLLAAGRFGAAAVAGTVLMQGVSTAYKGLYATLKTGFQQKRKMRGLDFAGDPTQFYTQKATTMRQRAVQAMNRSHMNARSAFGQEAQLMHSHRDAFSTYRRM